MTPKRPVSVSKPLPPNTPEQHLRQELLALRDALGRAPGSGADASAETEQITTTPPAPDTGNGPDQPEEPQA